MYSLLIVTICSDRSNGLSSFQANNVNTTSISSTLEAFMIFSKLVEILCITTFKKYMHVCTILVTYGLTDDEGTGSETSTEPEILPTQRGLNVQIVIMY